MTLLVSKGKRMVCQKCRLVLEFERDVDRDELPCRFMCDQCGFEMLADRALEARLRSLPKVDGMVKSHGVWVVLEGEESQSKAIEHHPVQDKSESKQPSFREQANQVSKLFLSALQGATELRNSVDRLVLAISEDMERSIGEHGCIESWNPRLLFQFLLAPIGAIQAQCIDKSIESRTRFLICPKFYPRIHGIPVSLAGGFYFQIITPYSMIGFPLERNLCDALAIPHGTRLQIAGDKVFGEGLFREWMHVDGTVPDDDHAINNPSILIKDRRLVRTWIAKNGGKPWRDMDIESRFYPYHAEMLDQEAPPAIAELRNRFPCTGRLVICWENIDLARMAMAVIGHGMRRAKVILHHGCDLVDYHKHFKMEFADKRLFVKVDIGKSSQQEIENYIDQKDIDLLVLDISNEMPSLQFLHSLHRYEGPMIILLRDPFMDMFDDNEYASAVYSLVNDVSFMHDSDAWRNAWKAYEQSPPDAVQRALQSMRVKWGRDA